MFPARYELSFISQKKTFFLVTAVETSSLKESKSVLIFQKIGLWLHVILILNTPHAVAQFRSLNY
jgi:hypothetical protein